MGKTYMITNIFPRNVPPKKGYLVTITEEISKFVIKNYSDTFDPTISYSSEKSSVGWSARKNASIGICRRIPRVIYNESKIEKLDYAHLIELASHECAHLVYDGHGKQFQDAFVFILDTCIDSLEKAK